MSEQTFECEKVDLTFFESAPTIHRASVEIDATPDDVFEAFLDADAWTEWAMPITRVEWTSDFPLEAGSTRTVYMKGNLVGDEEFLAYEHGSRMAFRFNSATKDSLNAFAEDYRVTDLGGGRSRVEWTMAMDSGDDGSSLRGKVMNPVMGFMVKRMLKKFGRLVETRRSAS
ncbi:MAG: SRPBCC family protein [Acidimicrobiales bacterium]|nr:SRPBCC family protein [Acidimicrobiales bacterium]